VAQNFGMRINEAIIGNRGGVGLMPYVWCAHRLAHFSYAKKYSSTAAVI